MLSRSFWYWCLVLVLLASVNGTYAQMRPSLPEVRVPSGVRGEAAVTALGSNLTAVAAHYGRSAGDLAKTFRSDHSLRLNSRGQLYYACEGMAIPDDAIPAASGDTSVAALAPLSQTFLLHSKPGATKIIYLDFDGFTITNTQWNSDYSVSVIYAPPWDTDGDTNSFGTGEQTAIQQIWYRVAEDYAAFDVDVTTEYPGESALTRSSNGDQSYGVRALISPISSYFGSFGGIAYVGVFNDLGDYNKPALIFPEKLSNSEKYIGEAVAHEVGHTLGLSHDGVTGGDAYYSGQGNWAPIMGVGYYKPITQWSKGEYTGANNTEDDLLTILQNGLSYRANDFGTNRNTATVLTGYNISTNGIIARTGQSDYTKFTIDGGVVSVSVTPWERGSDLHCSVSLLDSVGNVLTNVEAVDSSSGTGSVSFSQSVPAGTYYTAVTGKGSGDPLTTGYSAYASLGQYVLTLSLPAPYWTPVAAGNYTWTKTTNWLDGQVPNAADTIVKITNNIAGSQTVSLNTSPVIGQLWLGYTNSAGSYWLGNGSGGPLKFDVNAGQAMLRKTSSGTDNIAASILPLDALVISNGTVGTLTLSGPISGTNQIIKAGPGLVNMNGTNTFSGALTVSNGVLVLGPNSSLACPLIEIKNGGVFDISSQTDFVLGPGQTIFGNGTLVGEATINGILAPGSSIGSLTVTGAVTLAAGGRMVCEINTTNNLPGVGHDVVNTTGVLTISATSMAPFTLRPVAPALVGWNAQENYVWTIATATGGISGFDTNNFVVDASAFTNNLSGGRLVPVVVGNSLQLHFIALVDIPEISTANFSLDGAFEITASGTTGSSYRLWATTNLSAMEWIPLATNMADINGRITFSDPTVTNAAWKFYRISSP